MARGDQLARQWKIIQTLTSSRMGKAASELAADLDCHSRTIYRDLEALQAAGFPVYTDKVAGKNLWALLDNAKHSIPIPFNLPELMALYFSRGMMKVLKGTVFYDSLVSLFDKIKATLPGDCVDYLERFEKSMAVKPKPYKQYRRLRSIIEKVSEAAIQKKRIVIDYHTMSRNKSTRRKVSPYKIWFFDDTFYLIGNCSLRKDIRIFAMDRIQKFELTNESFEMPTDFDVDNFMKSSFGIFQGERVRVSIWFAAEIAAYIREKNWHETQQIQTLTDGSVIFKAEVAGMTEIKYWVLQWGANAKVLKPESLRAEVRAEAEAMLGNYSS